ncbi:hypothetical protein AVEN_83236-1 [Araneus ventricosus]|uniref:Uncharacterized protein n=1 Tax=Araneus ventricosus TaxID=182803 RepID=A0A4Y2TQI3_ARAVE|nr:hypothetical protein AVEN_83236-1 [Araneus ventricosus]
MKIYGNETHFCFAFVLSAAAMRFSLDKETGETVSLLTITSLIAIIMADSSICAGFCLQPDGKGNRKDCKLISYHSLEVSDNSICAGFCLPPDGK